MINSDHDITKYVEVVIIKKETRVEECFKKSIQYRLCAKYVFKSCALAKLPAEVLFRFQ